MNRSAVPVVTLGIIAFFLALNADFFFHHPYYEFWDSAANSLSILRAKHFAQIYGPYSRYEFYHPGAGYFYVDALGEWIFYDLLHLVPAPYNGQLLIHLCLMTGFFVCGLNTLTHWIPARKWFFVCVALMLGILHFGAMDQLPSFYDPLGGPSAFLSNWSAHFLVLPFFCLLAAAASVGAGRGKDLPLLVIAGGFLVHAHVAQPLFVVPVAILAYGGFILYSIRAERALGVVNNARARWSAVHYLKPAWRASPRAHLAAGLSLAVFSIPLVIDLRLGSHSNMAAIWRHLHEHPSQSRKLITSLCYFLQFAAYNPYQPGRIDFGHYEAQGFSAYLRAHTLLYAGWLCVAALMVRALFTRCWFEARSQLGLMIGSSPPPVGTIGSCLTDTRRFLAWASLLTLLTTALSLYWGTRRDGLMYYYNSWFNFGIYYFAALVATAVLCVAWIDRAVSSNLKSGRGRTHIADLLGKFLCIGTVALTAFLSTERMRVRDRYGADKTVPCMQAFFTQSRLPILPIHLLVRYCPCPWTIGRSLRRLPYNSHGREINL